MDILVLGQNYWPEQTAVGPYTTELCEHLVSLGHRVKVITTFPHYPEYRIHKGYEGRWSMREEHNGVQIHRVYAYIPGNGKLSVPQRILYDSTLGATAFLAGLAVGKVDAMLAISPPLQLGVTAHLLSLLKRAHFGFLVQDLVPDAAVQVGMMRNGWAIRAAKIMERYVYDRARVVIVIGRGFWDNLRAKGVAEDKLLLLPNWVDTEFIRPIERPSRFLRANNLGPDEFLVLHAGNMGAKQGLSNVIAAADNLCHLRDVRVVLVGDGAQRDMLQQEAKTRRNVRVLPLQPRELLPDMLSSAEVLLLNQRADVITPSAKLLTYMAAGRPVVAAVHEQSETARFVRESGCGFLVAPEDPGALARAIESIHDDPQLADRLGKAGRRYAEDHLTRNRVLEGYADMFERLSIR